ncbi:hypothetical protein Taro_042794 [Colocasia esculenta]|uniref:Uncharacterized protein n=1 Tax=Colocasia esculenta TaxID=4460 RepID=A0A843WXE8_COLES|nr:hypothetical protein [Colocasia esculenta]
MDYVHIDFISTSITFIHGLHSNNDYLYETLIASESRSETGVHVLEEDIAMASRGRRGAQARDDEHRREERGEQLKLQLQFLRSMAMVVRPSWRGLRGWLHLLLSGRVSLS